MRRLIAIGVILLTLGGVRAPGQSNPQALPLVQPSGLTFLGEFDVPWDDGSCDWRTTRGCLSYAGWGLTMGADNTLNLGCHAWTDQFARIAIPAIGERASVVQRCQGLSNISSIDPDDAPNGYTVGGILDYNDRKIVSAFSYYDNPPNASKSHWVIAADGTEQGPFQVGTLGAGRVGGYMALIPREWRALFGGPALTGLCCTSIISRSSFGPALSVFDPDQLGKVEPVPTTTLLYYDGEHPLEKPSENQMYNFTTLIGGVAFVEGTRTVMFVGRHGTGPYCYGPSAGPNAACRDDPGNQTRHNSYHAYPYRHQVWLYDANDLLQVKEGKKEPWEPKPYATGVLPGTSDTHATISGATYDPSTQRLYLTTEYGESPKVYVFSIAFGRTPQDRQ